MALKGAKVKTKHLGYWRKIRGFGECAQDYVFDQGEGRGNISIKDYYATFKNYYSNPPGPIYNMRHIHPVRQSGPIPPYDGPYTIEDIKKLYG